MPNLNVPHLTQLDNANNPHGSCNVTALAMAMKYHYPDRNFGCPSGKQLEDFLYEKMLTNGRSRHSPFDLQWLIHSFPGFKDEFSAAFSINDIRQTIDQGNPCIAHLWLTSFGHIIVIRGYEGNHFYVNDPFGEWHRSGYVRGSTFGENIRYSDRLISAVGVADSHTEAMQLYDSGQIASTRKAIWIHKISKA